jgi:hypothetical protein
MMLEWIIKYKRALLGIVFGGMGGFLYYYFVGCANGQCIISSNPLVSVPYGALLGYLISGIIKK